MRDMGDWIRIEGLRVEVLVGVYAHERDATQPLLFDIDLAYDNRRAAEHDAVGDTIDYAAVCASVRACAAEQQPQLLETLAETVAARLMRDFGSPRVRVRLHKPLAAEALGAASVGVEIVRSRDA